MIFALHKNRDLAIILTILIAIEIFYFSTLQIGGSTREGISWTASLYHFTVFFLFAFFLFMSMKNKEIKISNVILVLTISVIYAISDEIHQMFVPLRDAGIKDILIDTLGICSAMLIGLIIKKKTIDEQT
jgi:VanZ family protein